MKPLKSREGFFTYGDYAKWPDEERWELIEGKAYDLTPTPYTDHQMILGECVFQFAQYCNGKTCETVISPLDVLLPKGDEPDEAVDTVVQPDIMVVCDRSKCKEIGIRGAPDLLVEVFAPWTVYRDLALKLRLYERHNVRCYIMIDPWGKIATVRYLESPGRYGVPEFFTEKKPIPVRIFEGLVIDLVKVFEDVGKYNT